MKFFPYGVNPFKLLLIVFFFPFISVAYAQTAPTELISADSSGQVGNGQSVPSQFQHSISADNRYVVFTSRASNLVPNDTNGFDDVFLKDRQTGTVELMSVSTTGDQGNKDSSQGIISRDGRYVVFYTESTNFGSGAGAYLRDRVNGTTEYIAPGLAGSISADGRYVAFGMGGTVYVKDRLLNTSALVSADSSGNPGNGYSEYPSMSSDGRYIAFQSRATNLVPNDINGYQDIFFRDMTTGITTRASVNSAGEESNKGGADPQISGNGNFIIFSSYATNLTSTYTYDDSQVYVYDRINATTEIASINNQGVANNNTVFTPMVSDDGRYVAFQGHGSTLGYTGQYEDNAFRRDRLTNTLEMASSYNSTCTGGPGSSGVGDISPDGRFIFYYLEFPVIPSDTNSTYDVYLRDMNIATPISCTLSNLFSAKVKVGLADSADSGIKFDLRARVYKNGDLLSGDKVVSVDGGGTGFANAINQTIPLPAITPVELPPGTVLSIKLAVRNACTGSAKNSGTARLWYNGQAADSRFKVTLGVLDQFYFLRDNFTLSTQQGAQGEKLFIDVPVGAQCGDWQQFGTWKITL